MVEYSTGTSAERIVSTSFHLAGISLFGCCPDSAYQTFNGYARLRGTAEVPVFKREEPLRLRQDGVARRIGYQNTQVWSKSFGSEKLADFPKGRFRLVVLELHDEFFRFRGPVLYCVRLLSPTLAEPIGEVRKTNVMTHSYRLIPQELCALATDRPPGRGGGTGDPLYIRF